MKNTKPRIRHVMKDGTVRDSVEGVVITNKEFYEVMRRILREDAKTKRKECEE